MKIFIPSFDQFVNESNSINEAKKIKDFDKVKVGDKAKDYGDETSTVIAKGYGRDYDKILAKYDSSGAVLDMKHKPSAFGMTKSDWDNLELIAVENSDGEFVVYTYDPDGACVYESTNEAKDDYVPATLVKDSGDLRKGQTVKVNALNYTKRGDKEKVEIIRPDGKKSEILKGDLSVKI
jgi:hypothetical protein